MLAPALRLDMALYSTSMAYDLALPIVARPIVALPIVALSTFRVSSSTVLRYKVMRHLEQDLGPCGGDLRRTGGG